MIFYYEDKLAETTPDAGESQGTGEDTEGTGEEGTGETPQ